MALTLSQILTKYLVAPVLNWTGLGCDKNQIATEKPNNPSLKWTEEFVVGGWGGMGWGGWF